MNSPVGHDYYNLEEKKYKFPFFECLAQAILINKLFITTFTIISAILDKPI